jgi:DNA-binding NtrC family response regulator
MQHILTIDDEEQIREILGQVLRNSGYRVTAVESAAEAVTAAQRDRPDLVITDLQLEESDGFELIDELQKIAPGVPIMLLTGVLFDPAMVKRLGEKKIAAYVEKTASLERILREVRGVLEGKK